MKLKTHISESIHVESTHLQFNKIEALFSLMTNAVQYVRHRVEKHNLAEFKQGMKGENFSSSK